MMAAVAALKGGIRIAALTLERNAVIDERGDL